MAQSNPNQSNTITSTMREVMNYFKVNSSLSVRTPLSNSCFVLSKDYFRIYFISIPTDQTSRIGLISLVSEEVIIDEEIYEKPLALSLDERYLYAAGHHTNIIKFDSSTLEVISELSEHSRYINKIIINNPGNYLFSASDDHRVIM